MKAENFLQLESDLKHERDSTYHYWKGPCKKHEKEYGQPQLTASKELGTSVLQPKGTKFSQQSE